jgi:RHS repeat-associated protein
MTFRLRGEQQQALAQSNVGNRLAALLSSGAKSAYYDSQASCVRVVGARNQRTQIDLDGQGNVLRLVSPLGRETRYHYERDRPVAVQLPTGLTLRTHYDAQGRVCKSERSDGESQELVYDAQGNLAAFRTADGATLRLGFGPEQRLERTLERDGGEVRRRYDEAGRLLEVTDPLGRKTSFGYGASDEAERIEQPDGCLIEYTHRVGEIAESVGASAHAEYTNDEQGRLTGATYADGYALSLTYDDAGKVVSATSADSRVELEYDQAGRVSAESQDGRVLRYAYNEEGQLAALTLPDGRSIAYEYDLDGRVSVARDWGGQQQRFHYGAAEHPLHRELPTGVVESYELDAAGRVTGIDLHNRREVSWSQRYRRDVVGRVVEQADSRSGLRRYRYDAQGRLLGVEDGASAAQREWYTYDAASQRVASHAGPAAFDAMCRPLQSGDNAYAYDDLGNRVQAADRQGAMRYAWTGPNLLREVTLPSGAVVRYFYDAFGRRVRKQLADTSISYVWAGNHLVQELHEGPDGVRSVEYLYFPGSHRPLAKCDGGRVYYYHCDQLGTPLLLTDAAVRLVWSASYTAFGGASAEHQFVAQPLRLPGQYFDDETGLHYNRARYYDPALGVYLSRDPLSPAGENAYVYAGANPINVIDPLGLRWEDAPGWVKTTATIAAGVAVGAAVLALAPAALAATTLGAAAVLVAAGIAGGAAAGGLDAAMTEGGCVLCGMGRGAVVGGLASLPFLFAPAGAGLVIMAGFGMASGAVGYLADVHLFEGEFSWTALGESMLLGAALGAAARFIVGRGRVRGKGAPREEPVRTSPHEESASSPVKKPTESSADPLRPLEADTSRGPYPAFAEARQRVADMPGSPAQKAETMQTLVDRLGADPDLGWKAQRLPSKTAEGLWIDDKNGLGLAVDDAGRVMTTNPKAATPSGSSASPFVMGTRPAPGGTFEPVWDAVDANGAPIWRETPPSGSTSK